MTPQLIVVCDDEAPLRRTLSDHLTECGFHVLQAANAQELSDLLQAEEPDLVLLDVRMPGKDGLAALRDIRETSTIPVMMPTAAGEVVDKVLGLEFGADDNLVKPVDLRELQARVKAALRRGGMLVAKPDRPPTLPARSRSGLAGSTSKRPGWARDRDHGDGIQPSTCLCGKPRPDLETRSVARTSA